MPITLKQRTGWFASGPEMVQALLLLSDAAFRMYVYVCLNASKLTGSLTISKNTLLMNLSRDRKTLVQSVQELIQKHVCVFHDIDPDEWIIEVVDDFWPYVKIQKAASGPSNPDYFLRVKAIVQARACTTTTFSPAERQMIFHLESAGIAFDIIDHAVLLGSARRYVALLNGTANTPIISFLYFRGVLDEIPGLQVPVEYWQHLELRVLRMEKLWLKKQASLNLGAITSGDNPETR